MGSDKLFELRRRTFDTPHFRGIEFIETEAKSVINNVPGNYLPFNWTINPYRGCSHACLYCQVGETPILMADGRTKPLADVKVGDAIFGTEAVGSRRRYVVTKVLAHWKTVKPSYRLTLADGTELVASPDHRFLTEQGWRHVHSSGAHLNGRALDSTHRLAGVGAFRDAIEEGLVVETPEELRVTSVKSLEFESEMFDITTGTGDFIANGVVSHNCFARSTHTYMDMNAGRDFETKIVVKVNASQVLRKELRAKKWKGEHIAMGTATDPYQRAEGKYKLMRGIIGELIEVRNPFSVLTKGTLILRDLDLLQEAAEHTDVSTAFSIPTLDEDAWRKSEPGTPHPRKRMDAVRKLNDQDIPCGVMIAAILPGITDRIDQLKEVVHAAVDSGATFVTPIMLHLRPKVKEVYMDWLGETYPHLVDRYEAMYGRSAYASKDLQKELSNKVRSLVDEAPKPQHRPRRVWRNTRRVPEKKVPENEQLSLI